MADGSLLFNTKLNTTGFTKGLSKVQGLAKTGLGKVGSFAQDVGKKLTTMHKVAGVALIGLGVFAIKAGAEFEAQMSRVQAISGATGDELEALNKQALQLGADTAFSAAEAAAGMENLASAGFKVNEITAAMPGLLDMAAVSGGDVALAAEVAASTIRAFGLEASEAGHVADVFAQAASSTNAEVGDMGEAMKYVAPVAKAMGQEMEMTAAAIGIMSDAGIKGSQAGTSLRGVFSRLAKPTKAMKETMKELGVSFYDAKGNMLPMTGIIAELQKGTNGLTQEQKNNALITLFGQESLSGMLALVDAGPEKLAALTGELKNADGAAQDMAETMLNNTKGAIDEFKGSLETLGITIYSAQSGPLKSLAEMGTGYLNQLTKAFNGMGDTAANQSQRVKDGVILMNDGFIETESGMSGLASTFGNILGDMAVRIAESAPGMVKGAKALIGSFFDGLKSNADALGSAASEIITGLIDIFFTYAGEFLSLGMSLLLDVAMGMAEKAPELVGTMVDAFSKVTTAVFEAMPLLLEAGGQIVLNLVAGISKNASAVFTVLLDMANLIVVTLIDIAPELIKTGFELISNLAKGIAQYIPELMTSIATLIPTILNALIEGIPQLFEAGLVILKAIVDGIILSLPLLIEAIPQLITALYTALTEALPTLLEAGLQILTALLNGILENLPLLIQAAITILTGLVTFIMENLPVLIQAAIDILTAIVNGIVENLPMIIDAIIQLIDSIVLTVTENLPVLIEMAIEMIVTIMQALIDNLDKIIAATVLLIDALIAAVVENLPAIIEATIKIIITIAEALVNNLDKLIPPMIDLINTLVDAIIERLDLIIDAAIKIIQAVVKGLIDNLPKIIEATLKLVRAITKEIIARLPELVQSGLKIISEVARGIVENLPKVFEATGKLVGKIVETAISLLPDILATGAAFVAELVSGLLGALGSLVSTADDLANAAVEAIGKGFAGAFNIGKNLVEGIWNGIGSVKNWVLDKISGFAGGIMDGIKGFFGIKSPSRRMRDEVGKQLPPGVGVGFKAAMPDLIKTADDEMDKLEKHIKAGIDLDQTFQAEGSKQAVKQIAQYDYVISDDGKKMALSGDIHSTINIDGRPVAKAITPYVSEEQSLGRKRRM